MPASFDTRKAKILSELDTPDEQYEDLSPKGSVDSGIRDLILEINALPQYVTTSSCAGRVSAYLEGTKGAKGGGQWLFTSHEAVDAPVADGAVNQLLGLENEEVAVPSEVDEARFVHLKFEPMILHILTASPKAAQHAATAALTAGFRESGITGILPSASNHPATPMVAVRSSGLVFDCIIGYSTNISLSEPDSSNVSTGGEAPRPKIVPMVSEGYLRTLLGIANQRFKTNEERRERFRKALLNF
ncbi:hypothetical protein LTR01_005070 [Friedmanniomyces endolithicus]|uniref:tRNA(Phe) 7-[(3-amino-3-carboxypropyl)-4-demethylwyosine(37)-N(4)]-methyltransferase n=1 Tax=Friedmanniomyces endolithicus TaxID=329885 RepID=A0AAN6FZK8_9PEZI|nr:hypothetical protein LTR01_005070 [Friedmanniomyces endolithicus]KAK0326310.1 hypothetical protein LTR82_003057 [Friedmanniomyces endolithicus]KAK0829325.1 hypothetical protein LTR73_004269 [Friedmanniomyces endolithicus]